MSTIRRPSEPIVLQMAHAIARYIGFGEDDAPHGVPSLHSKSTSFKTTRHAKSRLRVVRPETEEVQSPELHKWQRHPQLREYTPSIPEEVRSARHEAVRGLCAARAGAVEVAHRHFSVAAKCEQVDLTAVPGFWSLTRGQMQIAVDAYEQVGRYRDGAALDAHIATIFRPSLVGADTPPVMPRENRDTAANT